ncbi:uncharacterized protein LOC118736432 [Rhagoletis pomonella]|uniref:uncharacterized protein LOC118736432 n=1 Tax=Rhagoletis pomonella TaxID=28610 RepID=UPI0017851965|nr:uncharacterized protein LOC118736432 [Rhagoletis pomonella]
MEREEPCQTFLLTCEMIKKVNHTTICQLFDKSMTLLWPEGVRHDDVLLFVTDAAPYMVKAGKSINSFYPKMIHLTCLAHALHRVAEEVRSIFPVVDGLISKTKKVFIKAPSRKDQFKMIAPGVPFPPEPVITRWGTLLSACAYYCEHFEAVKNVINSFNSLDARAIEEAQLLFSNDELKGQLAYIRANFSCISKTIESLQSKHLSLEVGVNLIEDLKSKLSTVHGVAANKVYCKLNQVLGKNVGYKSLKSIANVLNGENFNTTHFNALALNDIVLYKTKRLTKLLFEESVLAMVVDDSNHTRNKKKASECEIENSAQRLG